MNLLEKKYPRVESKLIIYLDDRPRPWGRKQPKYK